MSDSNAIGSNTVDNNTVDSNAIDWRTHGVRVVPGDRLDFNTPQTPGMLRGAAINHATVGATNCGPAASPSSRMPRLAPIITARWKA